MFTKMAHEAFMKLKQVRRRSWGGGYHIYIYACVYIYIFTHSTPQASICVYLNSGFMVEGLCE